MWLEGLRRVVMGVEVRMGTGLGLGRGGWLNGDSCPGLHAGTGQSAQCRLRLRDLRDLAWHTYEGGLAETTWHSTANSLSSHETNSMMGLKTTSFHDHAIKVILSGMDLFPDHT